MHWIDDISQLRDDLNARAGAFLEVARSTVVAEGASIDQRLATIASLRTKLYEATNQLQHEYLLVRAVEWLVAEGRASEVVRWGWHPSCTGPSDEPDLRGLDSEDKVVISAEATASSLPQGVIDTRMAKTLMKVAMMGGQRFYFVTSVEMERRARTKVSKSGHLVEVVRLSGPLAGVTSDDPGGGTRVIR